MRRLLLWVMGLGLFGLGLGLLVYAQSGRFLTETQTLGTLNEAVIEAGQAVQLLPTADVPPSLQTEGGLDAGQGGAEAFATARANPSEQRLVELEMPRYFRMGSADTVRLTLKQLDDGSVSVQPEVDGNALLATPILITDRYDTHLANFKARLSAPDFEIETTTPETQILERGEAGTWRWNLTPQDDISGRYVVTLGIDLVWTSKPEFPQEIIGPRPVWGQAFQVETRYVFGSITVPQASILGTIIAVVGFVAQIPFLGRFLSGFGRLIFGGNKKKKSKSRT